MKRIELHQEPGIDYTSTGFSNEMTGNTAKPTGTIRYKHMQFRCL